MTFIKYSYKFQVCQLLPNLIYQASKIYFKVSKITNIARFEYKLIPMMRELKGDCIIQKNIYFIFSIIHFTNQKEKQIK